MTLNCSRSEHSPYLLRVRIATTRALFARFDKKRSWPLQGKLRIDNFTYAFGSVLLFGQFPIESPRDTSSRLRWLGRGRKADRSPVATASSEMIERARHAEAAIDARIVFGGNAGDAARFHEGEQLIAPGIEEDVGSCPIMTALSTTFDNYSFSFATRLSGS